MTKAESKYKGADQMPINCKYSKKDNTKRTQLCLLLRRVLLRMGALMTIALSGTVLLVLRIIMIEVDTYSFFEHDFKGCIILFLLVMCFLVLILSRSMLNRIISCSEVLDIQIDLPNDTHKIFHASQEEIHAEQRAKKIDWRTRLCIKRRLSGKR